MSFILSFKYPFWQYCSLIYSLIFQFIGPFGVRVRKNISILFIEWKTQKTITANKELVTHFPNVPKNCNFARCAMLVRLRLEVESGDMVERVKQGAHS
jgi:hypothetical protein